MKIGILVTGAPPADLEQRFGGYDAMIRRLLGDGHVYRSYRVAEGELPEHGDQEAYIVTGSPAAVYEDHPWIEPLMGFLREARGKAKLVGICFGHQIMAQAFGGKVQKSERGWGIGLHRYKVAERAPWMDKEESFAVPVSHQDQVVVQPPGSRVLAGSRFNPFGLLAYADGSAVSMQCHPEFEPAFAKALIGSRRDGLDDPDAAIASLDQPNDRERVGRWILSFLAG